MNLSLFLGLAAGLIVSPGPDTMLTVKNTMLYGRSGGIATAVGVSSGQAVWAVASALSVAALLRAWQPGFVALQLAGAGYLTVLGVLALRDAFRVGGSLSACDRNGAVMRSADISAERRLISVTALSSWRQGFFSNLANPKMAIFFLSLLPQFTGSGSRAPASSLVLGSIFCLMTLTWLSTYAVVVSKASRFVTRRSLRGWLQVASGTALIGLGVRITAESI